MNPYDIPRVQTPQITGNGDIPETLSTQAANACDALALALETLRAAYPNGRNYIFPDAYKRAVTEHDCRIGQVRQALDDMTVIREHADEEAERREALRARNA